MTVAVLARESRAISPAKASLTMLLSQAARLTAERHPLDERLRRIDAAMAEHARKVARRDVLRQQWEAARAQAILDVDDWPPLPDELIEAEREVEPSQRDQPTLEQARERVIAEMDGINVQLSKLQPEIKGVVEQVVVDETVAYLRGTISQAKREYDRLWAVFQGAHAVLLSNGQRQQAQRRDASAMRALERLERKAAIVMAEWKAAKAVNEVPARTLLEALSRDAGAELSFD